MQITQKKELLIIEIRQKEGEIDGLAKRLGMMKRELDELVGAYKLCLSLERESGTKDKKKKKK